MGNSHANDLQCWLPGVRDRENRRSGTVKRCRGCSRARKAHQLRIYPWLPRGVPAPSITAFVFFFRGDRSKSRNFARFGRDLGHNGAAKFFAIWARFGYKHAKIRNEIWVVRARKTASPQYTARCAGDCIWTAAWTSSSHDTSHPTQQHSGWPASAAHHPFDP